MLRVLWLKKAKTRPLCLKSLEFSVKKKQCQRWRKMRKLSIICFLIARQYFFKSKPGILKSFNCSQHLPKLSTVQGSHGKSIPACISSFVLCLPSPPCTLFANHAERLVVTWALPCACCLLLLSSYYSVNTYGMPGIYLGYLI